MNKTAIDRAKTDYHRSLERLKKLSPELARAFPDVSQITEPDERANLHESPNEAGGKLAEGVNPQNSRKEESNERKRKNLQAKK